MHRLIPHSQLRIYHGGHLELAADTERLASAVEAFLNADLTAPILMICRGSWRRFTLPKCDCWRMPMSLSASFPNGISGGRLAPEREPCW